MVSSSQPSWFEGVLGLQPRVLVDQGLHSDKGCLETSPKHLFDLRKKATAQVLLPAHASPEVLPGPQCPKIFGRTRTDNHHGALDSNNLHLQPFSRLTSLLIFSLIR